LSRKFNWLSKIIKRNWLIIVLAIILVGGSYVYLAIGRWPDWTGFGEYISPAVQPDQTFQRGKTFWDLMQLLIVPVVLAGGAYLLNKSARMESALQTYLDKMTELLLDKKLSESEQYLYQLTF
jgi:hypothetical protein